MLRNIIAIVTPVIALVACIVVWKDGSDSISNEESDDASGKNIRKICAIAAIVSATTSILSLVNPFDIAQEKLVGYQDTIDKLEEDNSKKDGEIDELNETISTQEENIAQLNETIASQEETILGLNETVSNQEEIINQFKGKGSNNSEKLTEFDNLGNMEVDFEEISDILYSGKNYEIFDGTDERHFSVGKNEYRVGFVIQDDSLAYLNGSGYVLFQLDCQYSRMVCNVGKMNSGLNTETLHITSSDRSVDKQFVVRADTPSQVLEIPLNYTKDLKIELDIESGNKYGFYDIKFYK